ncbi:MAG: YdeI family protein [Chitinophagales bacterium]
MPAKNPTFFADQNSFRKWFEANHDRVFELAVGFYKVNSGKASITWPQAVDVALCFGWIDGVRKSLGEESYMIRFTPRKEKSIWSAVNIWRVEELSKLKLMHPKGIAAFEKREEKRSRIYSFEQKEISFSKEFEKQFRKNKKAWNNFHRMPPSYRKPAMWWVISAKTEETKLKRLVILIQDSQAGKKIKRLNYGTKN